MVEFDISGRKVALAEAEVVWLRDCAGRGAGYSAARRDLAGLLQHALDQLRRRPGAIAFSRGEARTARRLLEERPPESEGLRLLQALLALALSPAEGAFASGSAASAALAAWADPRGAEAGLLPAEKGR